MSYEFFSLFRFGIMLVVFCIISNVDGPPVTRETHLKRRILDGEAVMCVPVICRPNTYFESCKENGTFDMCGPCKRGSFNRNYTNTADFDIIPDFTTFCLKPNCTCPPEAKQINHNCTETGISDCECDRSRNYFGQDSNICTLFSGTCPAGTELNNGGTCSPCKDGFHKQDDKPGLCEPNEKLLEDNNNVTAVDSMDIFTTTDSLTTTNLGIHDDEVYKTIALIIGVTGVMLATVIITVYIVVRKHIFPKECEPNTDLENIQNDCELNSLNALSFITFDGPFNFPLYQEAENESETCCLLTEADCEMQVNAVPPVAPQRITEEKNALYMYTFKSLKEENPVVNVRYIKDPETKIETCKLLKGADYETPVTVVQKVTPYSTKDEMLTRVSFDKSNQRFKDRTHGKDSLSFIEITPYSIGLSKLSSPIDYLDCAGTKLFSKGIKQTQCSLSFDILSSRDIARGYKYKLKLIMDYFDLGDIFTPDMTLDECLLILAERNRSNFKNILAISCLLQLGADINATNKDKNTALNLAVLKRNLLLVRLLLSHENIDLFKENTDNENSISLCVKNHLNMCKNTEKTLTWNCPSCRKSLIAKSLTWKICCIFKNQQNSNYKIVDIWPGYQTGNELQKLQGLCIVAHTENEYPMVILHGIPLIWQNIHQVSCEGKFLSDLESGITSREPLANYPRPSISKNMAHELFLNHRNLNIISPSIMKSEGYGFANKVTISPIVALYCRAKGVIPVGEQQFPELLNGCKTDIREGYCMFGHGGPKDYHFNLKMGCCIGTVKLSKHGTLGGFVDIDNDMYALTCAHALYSVQELENKSFPLHREVIQPGLISGYQPNMKKQVFGKVSEAVFSADNPDETSIDAAIIKITDRLPVNGSFPIETKIKIERTGFTSTTLPEFDSGEIMSTIKEEDKRKDVLKFGSESGLTLGSLKLEGTHVRMENETLKIQETIKSPIKSFKMYGQYEVYSKCHYSFFALGDSGSLVLMLKDDKNLECIGMAIGLTTYGSCIVTPISDILNAFQAHTLPAKLKLFRNISTDNSILDTNAVDDGNLQSDAIEEHSDESENEDSSSEINSSGIDSTSTSITSEQLHLRPEQQINQEVLNQLREEIKKEVRNEVKKEMKIMLQSKELENSKITSENDDPVASTSAFKLD